MDIADTLWTALGAGLILLMLADVFHTLLYPHGSGPTGRAIMRGIWRLSKKLRGRASSVDSYELHHRHRRPGEPDT